MATIEAEKYPSEAGEITYIRVTNSRGRSVLLSSLGAGIVGVQVPDKSGKIENICLAYADAKDYLHDAPTMGKTAGRYANRICEGKLRIDGQDYQLAVNCGPHHLHGGPEGFQNKIWDVELLSNGVRFSYLSPDGDENYPAELKVAVEYRWSDDNELSISFEAVADAPTVVNLTNHAYWNLDGADSGNALHHEVKMKASRWLPTDSTLAPTGEYAEVKDTPMDFTEFKAVGQELEEDFPALKYGKGYDNCWVLDGGRADGKEEMIRDAVVMRSPESGRELHIDTDQPGVQLYSGNWLAGSPLNRSGRSYQDYEGIAIEAQGFPDAPNHPEFPSQSVDPANPYRRTIIYRFLPL